MMDLKEIIKWFIPCFHILRIHKMRKTKIYLIVTCLFFFLNLRPGFAANVNSDSDIESNNKINIINGEVNLSSNEKFRDVNQSEHFFDNPAQSTISEEDNFLPENPIVLIEDGQEIEVNCMPQRVDFVTICFRSMYTGSVRNGVDLVDSVGLFGNDPAYESEGHRRTYRRGTTLRVIFQCEKEGRTFGRPFKKMAQALIPLVFQMGAAATWAVVAALVGIKTLGVTLIILKLLLVAGAAKIGALFGHKGQHGNNGWEPPQSPQKEIHLHIHNGHQGHSTTEEHVPFSSWNRDSSQSSPEIKHVNIGYEPLVAGPPTISTPYGNYVRIDSGINGRVK